MFTMLQNKANKAKSNMPSKYIKHLFLYSKTDNVMFKANLDLEGVTVLLILEKWLKCGHRNN